MSEIPIQTPMHGAHEADEDIYLDDTTYAHPDYEHSYRADGNEGPTADIDLGRQPYEGAAETVPTSEVDLDSDPFADDLSKELAAAAPKHWVNRATIVIGALALVVGGFLGGVQVEKHYGTTATAANAANRRATGFTRGEGFGGGGFGFGGGTGAAGGGATTAPSAAAGSGATSGGSTTTGTVKLVDGTTLYVQLANSDIVTVDTNASTKVLIGKAAGKLSSLKTGENVTVTGTADSTGTVTAKTVTATP